MSRLTVARTSSPRWLGEHQQKTIFVLGGTIDGRSIPSLQARVESEAVLGVSRVVLDIRAVVACDRQGLVELARLRGRLASHPECVVDVVGARWSQFVEVLAREDQAGMDVVQGIVRELRRPIMIDPYRARPPREPERTVGVTAEGS